MSRQITLLEAMHQCDTSRFKLHEEDCLTVLENYCGVKRIQLERLPFKTEGLGWDNLCANALQYLVRRSLENHHGDIHLGQEEYDEFVVDAFKEFILKPFPLVHASPGEVMICASYPTHSFLQKWDVGDYFIAYAPDRFVGNMYVRAAKGFKPFERGHARILAQFSRDTRDE